jgi:hypothetical protein
LLLILLPLIASRKIGIRASLRAMSPETFWLLAWSLGGLLVMSCVPSKRIDRIFPIVPPLCLLLAAAVGEFRKQERLRLIIDRVCIAAIILAGVGTAGYAANRIAVARREHRDAFAVFGRAVVREVAEHHWRYGVVGGEDEGMALYVRRPEFLEPDQAASEWNSGKLDALVLPEEELAELLPRLRGAVPSKIGLSEPAGSGRRRYLFLVRS